MAYNPYQFSLINLTSWQPWARVSRIKSLRQFGQGTHLQKNLGKPEWQLAKEVPHPTIRQWFSYLTTYCRWKNLILPACKESDSMQYYYCYHLLPLLYNCVTTSLTELFIASEYQIQSTVGLLDREWGNNDWNLSFSWKVFCSVRIHINKLVVKSLLLVSNEDRRRIRKVGQKAD